MMTLPSLPPAPPRACANCPFKTKTVGSRGPIDSPFVIVGESPSAAEVNKGESFEGPATKILTECIPADFPLEPYFTNAFKCFPPPLKKDPTLVAQAAQCCHNTLVEEIKAHPRKVILALGNGALWSLTGNYDLKITKVRGTRYESPLAECGIVATTHPAYLLRGGGSLRQFKADVLQATDLATFGRDAIRKAEPPTIYIHNHLLSVRRLVDKILQDPPRYMAGDIETGGFDYAEDEILELGFGWCEDEVHIVPIHINALIKGKESFRGTNTNLADELKPILEHPNIKWTWHNGKFDIRFFRAQHGICARVDEDTMLMSYALDETGGVHDLETVSGDYIGAPNYKSMIDAYRPNKSASYRFIPDDVRWRYLGFDVQNTLRLLPIMRRQVDLDANTKKMYERTLLRASEFLAKVESNGFHTDPAQIDANDLYYSGIMAEQEQIINSIALEVMGKPINPNSWQQLQALLYDTLDLRINGKRPQSTDADTLTMLPDHPVVIALRTYRKAAKAHGTYVKGLREHVKADGRIYATYKLHGTVTGRLASSDPNLQNIPREERLRASFTSRPGRKLMEIDFSQAELRSLACLSRDKVLCNIYNTEGMSLHDETAVGLFGSGWRSLSDKAQKKEQKMVAKNVNFGIVYGITPYGLADQININGMRQGATLTVSHREAAMWLARWAKTYPEAWEFIQRCRRAPAHGYNLVTKFGRKRRPGVVTQDRLRALENEFANFPHQSSASDITLHTGIELIDLLANEFDTYIVNLVHDCLIMDCPDDWGLISECAKIVVDKMESIPVEWGFTEVPFKAEVEVGTRWGMCKQHIFGPNGQLILAPD
jgi:uracil-DNA glycosylase family 4